MKLITFFGAGAFIFFAACCMQKETAQVQQSIYDKKWNLKKIYTGDVVQSVSTKAFIRFDQAKGSGGGNGSCNSFGSNAAIDGNKISFSNIFSTKMYCEEVQSIENAYFKKLEQVNRFEVKNNRLTLYQDKNALLEFEAEGQ